jgi:hypothetical protein
MSEQTLEEHVAALREAAAASRTADRQVLALVRAAHEAGVSITLISETIGRSRPRVYKMLENGEDDQLYRGDVRTLSKTRWGQILDEALSDLLGRTGEASAQSIMGALGSRDLSVKASRYRLAVKNARGMPRRGTVEWARHLDAQEVAREIEAGA